MRVIFADSLDLGIAVTALMNYAVDKNDISNWAARVIGQMDDPPLYIYTMLDMDGYHGRGLHHEVGYAPSTGLETEEEFQYLREIAVRRGIKDMDYLGGKGETRLSASRKSYINELIKSNFGIEIESLPRLSSFSS